MKKILVIHNNYRYLGGEDIAVDREVEYLKTHFDVKVLYFDNFLKPKMYLTQIVSFIRNFNSQSIKRVHEEIRNFKPDIVYVHNTWFKISVGIFKYLKKHNIKTLIKVHNFRYICTKSFLYSKHLDGEKLCYACGLENSRFKIFNKYFKNSYFKSFFMIVYGKNYINVIKDNYFTLLVLTEFHRNYLIKLGVQPTNIFTHPNKIFSEESEHINDSEQFLLYAGRISSEKGVEELIKTFLKTSPTIFTLKIIGTGPLLKQLKLKYKTQKNIEFLGEVSNSNVLELMKKATAVITATKLYEGQPTLLCEASSLGVPSIFPNTGGIKEFFPKNYKLMFNQFDYDDLLEKIYLINNKELMNSIGLENRKYLVDHLNDKKMLDLFYTHTNE